MTMTACSATALYAHKNTKLVAGRALIGVDPVDSCRTHGCLDEQFTQEPSLLGSQFVQGCPAFTP